MWTFIVWNLAALAAATYCIAKAVLDLRARRYVLGVVGLASAAVFLITPIHTQNLEVALPETAKSQQAKY